MTSQPSLAWHAVPPASVASEFHVNVATGLTQVDAEARLATHGPNQLASKPPRPPWLKFLDQFKNFLVIVLLGRRGAGRRGRRSQGRAWSFAVVVLLNAALGFYQEHRAEPPWRR